MDSVVHIGKVLLLWAVMNFSAMGAKATQEEGIAILKSAASVSKAELWPRITVQGKTAQLQRLELSAPSNAVVKAVQVRNNQRVEQGDIILTLDQGELKQEALDLDIEIAQLQKNRETAQQREKKLSARIQKDQLVYEMAVKQVEKQRKLLEQKLVSRQQVEESAYHLAEKKAQWLQGQYQLSVQALAEKEGNVALQALKLRKAQINKQMAQGTIRAPHAGIVQAVTLHPGSAVKQGAPLCTVVPHDRSDIYATIPYRQYQPLRQALAQNTGGLPINIQIEGESIDAVVKAVLPSTADGGAYGTSVWIEASKALLAKEGQQVHFSARFPV